MVKTTQSLAPTASSWVPCRRAPLLRLVLGFRSKCGETAKESGLRRTGAWIALKAGLRSALELLKKAGCDAIDDFRLHPSGVTLAGDQVAQPIAVDQVHSRSRLPRCLLGRP